MFGALALAACSSGSLTNETCEGGSYEAPKCPAGEEPISCVDSTGDRHYTGGCYGTPDDSGASKDR
jgi:hypothetical protein